MTDRLRRWALSFVLIAAGMLMFAVAGAQASQAGGPVTGPVQRAGRWLVDSQGRAVVFHGFNVVRKSAPYYPANFGIPDAQLLAGEGFDVVRLGINWSAAEPTPGVYNDGYIDNVLSTADLLNSYGIRTILDMHQDAWGAATKGDGAPAWATLATSADGSFAAFWNNAPAPDGVGIQTHFDRLWQHIATLLTGHPGVIGIDPFNEPQPGSGYPGCPDFTSCPAFETGALHAFYVGVIAAIRAGGANQVVFPEGVPSTFGVTTLPAFSDPQTAISYHYYCPFTEFSTQDVSQRPSLLTTLCLANELGVLGARSSDAQSLNVPAFLGEFGGSNIDPDNAQQADIADGAFTSWTEWSYYQSEEADDTPGQGLLLNSGQTGSETNAHQDKLTALAVPYAQAIAGTPQTSSLNRTTGVYHLTYATAPVPGAVLTPGAVTQVLIPARLYPSGYSAVVTGATVVSAPGAPWLLLQTKAGATQVSLTVRGATSTPTQTPLQTGVFPIGS